MAQIKKPNQKLKPYLVLQYLLKHTDEENVISAEKIALNLNADYGIDAERRSVYKDIEEINKILQSRGSHMRPFAV